MKTVRRICVAFVLVGLIWAVAAAQDAPVMPEDSVGNGGRSTGGNFVLVDMIGQPVVGASSGGAFAVTSGVSMGAVGATGLGTGPGTGPGDGEVEPKLFLPSARRR